VLTFDWATVLTVVSTVVTALATAFLAVFTFVTLRYLRRQEDRAEQERFDQHRPLLIPTAELDIVSGVSDVVWKDGRTIIAVQNVGPGVALDVAGLLLGARDLSMSCRYTAWRPIPLPPVLTDHTLELWGGSSMIPSQATIGAHTLCAPDKPTSIMLVNEPPWPLLRLTLTYRDIYGRKHVSLFDYTSMWRWETVAIIENIPKDLLDLEEEAQRGPAGP